MPNDTHSRLTLYILFAIVAAVTLALVRPSVAVSFEVGGEIFLRLLTMMAVPLVMSSVMSGIIGLGDVRKLGRPGTLTVAYYLTTTVMAVVVGLVMVNLIQPGVGTVDQNTLDALAAAENVVGLENLTNVDDVPAVGAWVVALPMKIGDGSGGPVRIVALVAPTSDGTE